MTKVLAVCNTKGGSGKTMLTANLAYTLACNKKKVLLIDLSGAVESGITKTFLGASPSKMKSEQTIAGWLQSLAASNAIEPESLLQYIKPAQNTPRILGFCPIRVIAGTDNLSAYTNDTRYIRALRKALQHIKQQKLYDVVIIDCPSGEFGVCAKIAVAAADAVLVPTKLHTEDVQEAFAMLTHRLSTFVSAFNQQYPNDTINPSVVFAPIQVNMRDKNLISTQQTALHNLVDNLKSWISKPSRLNVEILPQKCFLPESDVAFSSFVPVGLRIGSIKTNQATKDNIQNTLNNLYHGIMNALGHQSKLCNDYALQYRKAA